MIGKGLLLLTLFAIASAVDYCSLCKDHSMCKYKPGPGPSCPKNSGYIKGGLTAVEKKVVLDEHNKLRQKIAIGKEDRFKCAADMAQLEWDNELAEIAQRWTNQCQRGHDTCRNTARFSVGQNYASKSTSSMKMDVVIYLKDMVNNWYNEVKDCDPSQVGSFTNAGIGGKVIGHFTQLIWAKTTKVGCGFVQTYDGKWNKATLICNYGPSGNYKNQKIYTTGGKCSKCSNKCSASFDGLCA